MKRARVGIIAAAVFAVASVAFAQAKPDFSGTWTLDPEASGMPAGGGAGAGGGGGRGGMMGGPVTIKQTADTLTIERTAGDAKVVTTYNLSGKEQENSMAGRGGTPMVSKYVSKWDGSKLVTTVTRDGQNGPQVSTETRSIEGGNMVVETQSTGRDGNPMSRKQVWKKSS
jgi:hypothetical protein